MKKLLFTFLLFFPYISFGYYWDFSNYPYLEEDGYYSIEGDSNSNGQISFSSYEHRNYITNIDQNFSDYIKNNDKINIKFSFRANGNFGNDMDIIRLVGANGSLIRFQFLPDDTFKFSYNNGNNTYILNSSNTYNRSTWYNIELITNFDEKKLTLNVNDTDLYVLDNLNFLNNNFGENISNFIISNNARPYQNLGLYGQFDDLKINHNMGPSLTCTTETIPDYTNEDVTPDTFEEIDTYIDDSVESSTYAYKVNSSNLNVIFTGVKQESNFQEFSYGSGSFLFDTVNNTRFSERKTYMVASVAEGVQYIKMLGNFGLVDIITYRNDNETIYQTYEDVKMNDWDTGFGFPIGGTGNGQVVIKFKNNFFQNTIDTLEIYAIGSNNTKQVEICENEETGDYTIDGEDWGGLQDPYVEIVGEATPTEINITYDKYNFFENGFCLDNVIPFPPGGFIYFDIQKPSGELVKSMNLYETGFYKYGSNTCTKITYDYHDTAGKYFVKGYYVYQGVTYDIHENFKTYTITEPGDESSADPFENTDFEVDTDGDGEIGFSEFFGFIGGFIAKIGTQANAVVGGFKELMKEFGKMGEFSFIPGAHAMQEVGNTDALAESFGYMQAEESGAMYNFFSMYKAFVFVVFAFIMFVIFMALKNK